MKMLEGAKIQKREVILQRIMLQSSNGSNQSKIAVVEVTRCLKKEGKWKLICQFHSKFLKAIFLFR